MHSIGKACTNISREEETNLRAKIEVEARVEASAVQSLRQESSVQESDSSVRSGSLTAANSEELKDQEEEVASTMESFQMTKLNWMNVLLLGGGFFLLFTAFQTTAFVQVNIQFFTIFISQGEGWAWYCAPLLALPLIVIYFSFLTTRWL